MTALRVPPPRTLAAAGLRSLLGGGTAFLALFVGVHAVLAATTDGLSAKEAVELVLICLPEAAFTLRRRSGPVEQAVIAAMLLAATALACSELPFDRTPPGYSAWQFGAISLVLLGLTLLGRYRYAAAVMAGVTAIAVGWSVATGHGPGPGVALVVRHVATLFVGGCFTVGYRRTMRSARSFRAVLGRHQAQELAALARAGARRAAVETVLEQAGPMLTALAEGRPLTAADRRELRVIEGCLRDRIRSPGLLVGRLPTAAAAARRRGVDVLLLDESAILDGARRLAAADWLAARLDGMRSGRFVGRLRDDPDRLLAAAGSEDTSESAAF